MKKTIFNSALIILVALTVASFTTLSEKAVNVKASKITWKGYKVTGEHEGTINIKEGNLNFADRQLTGGTFVIDMSSITVTDLEGSYKGKLEDHLKSDDFFGVESHPTASLKITKVEGKDTNLKVTGNLTIKNITNPITFDMIVTDNSATANLKVDRSKFDVRYRSTSFFDDLKDKAIYDEFDLNVNLKF
jgi:polyisoprenoid-binding protein YceI